MERIDVGAKVADVLRRHPKTFEVFTRYGCPDMRSGFFSIMSRIMTVRNAARVHRIPLDALTADLERVIQSEEGSDG